MNEILVMPDQSEIVPYEEADFPLSSKRFTLSLYPFKRVLCHWHQEFEFFFVEKGHPSYSVDGIKIPLKEGEGIFVNAKHPHFGYSPDGVDSEYICLVFLPSLLESSTPVKDEFVSSFLQNENLPYIKFTKEECLPLYQKARSIMEVMDKKEGPYQLLASSDLYSFWSSFVIMKKEENLPKVTSSSKALLVKKMLSFIYANYKEKLDVESIASSASLSKGYATRLFVSFLETTPMSYLNSYRIEKSSELLRDPTKNISEIASEVGFENPSYFSERFKEEKGISPKSYRLAQNEKKDG